MSTKKKLNGLVAVVTGGGSGFGEHICRAYAKEGAKILVADRDETKGEAVADSLRGEGANALFQRVDVAVGQDMTELAEATIKAFGRADIMVNNAGMSHPNQPMLEVDEEFFDRLYAVNVKSIYLSARAFVPIFRRQKSGCFINIGSTAAVRPRPGLSWYNGTKGAVTLISKSMAVELAPDNIRSNVIHPAIADTPLLTTFMGSEDSPESRKKFIDTIPLGRLCQPADVANAALFFADPASSFITGTCLEVDGGRCI